MARDPELDSYLNEPFPNDLDDIVGTRTILASRRDEDAFVLPIAERGCSHPSFADASARSRNGSEASWSLCHHAGTDQWSSRRITPQE
jgi:hypothetical protein